MRRIISGIVAAVFFSTVGGAINQAFGLSGMLLNAISVASTQENQLAATLFIIGLSGLFGLGAWYFLRLDERLADWGKRVLKSDPVLAEKESNKISMVGLFGEQLRAIPIDSILRQSASQPKPSPSKADTDEQKAAKQKLGLAARDVFYDADYALMPVICFARDNLQIRYGNDSKTAQAIGKGIDIMQGPPHHFKDQNIPLVHELRQPDKLREINLHRAQSAYYYNFAFYADKIRLLDDLLRKAGPYHPIRLEELKTKFNAWWVLHEELLKKNKELGEDIELYTIADIPKTIHPLPELPDLDDLVDKPVVRDTPIGRALGFLVSRNWNGGDFFNTISDGKAKDGRGEMALNELHQSMRDGELIGWGRKSKRHAWEQISPEHWSEYTFDFYSTWHDTMYQGAKDESIESEASENRSQYQDLMVSKSQVEKLWPNGLAA